MIANEMVIRQETVVICQRLYDKDIVPAGGGNVGVHMESMEMHARALTLAKIWGGAIPLPEETAEQLEELRRELRSG